MGVPRQPAFQRQPLLETSTTRSPGRYTPFLAAFLADPQVSSIAPGGNPRPYLELWSHADDVSLMGGVGGHQVGIEDVSELLTAAAKTLNYETWSAENLATGFDSTYGFTVELERLTRHMHGETEEMRLRATSIYRREDGFWKVVHRHGDSLMTVEIDPQGRR